jgi:hypothetical protein
MRKSRYSQIKYSTFNRPYRLNISKNETTIAKCYSKIDYKMWWSEKAPTSSAHAK